MPGQALDQAFGCIGIFDLADGETVETGDFVVVKREVGRRRPGLLALKGVALQETVQRRLTAIEALDGVVAAQFLDPQIEAHSGSVGSKTLGSRSNLARRGSGRGGASSAA